MLTTRFESFTVLTMIDLNKRKNAFTTTCNYPLQRAVKEQDIDKVKSLLLKQADPNDQDTAGWTSLMHALRLKNQDPRFIELLLDNKADVMIQDSNGNIALHFATHLHIPILGRIIQQSNINHSDNDGNTALHHAVKTYGIFLLIELLQNPVLQINIQNKQKQTALMLAAKSGDVELVKLLCNNKTGHTADHTLKDQCGRTAFYYAIASDRSTLVDYFFDSNMSTNDKDRDGNTPLLYALKLIHDDETGFQDTSVVECLIKKILEKKLDVDVNVQNNKGETALTLAFKWHNKNSTKLIIMLLKAGANDTFLDDLWKEALNTSSFFQNNDNNKDRHPPTLTTESQTSCSSNASTTTSPTSSNIQSLMNSPKSTSDKTSDLNSPRKPCLTIFIP